MMKTNWATWLSTVQGACARLLIIPLIAISVLACQEDAFPEGLYAYQAERLLSGGDTAIWELNSLVVEGLVFPKVCSDSIKLMVTAATMDSIGVFVLRPSRGNCIVFDTASLGNASASGELLFTDSVVFENGSYWVVQTLFPSRFAITTSAGEEATFERD